MTDPTPECLPPTPATATASIKAAALSLGFDAVTIARAGEIDPQDRLGAWLRAGFHADMAWMARTRETRQDIRQKLPGAQSVIVVARSYYFPASGDAASPKIARYARGRDYHKVLRKPLIALAREVDKLSPGHRSYCSIDSAPVLERGWAAAAGLGWVGKNSLILRRDMGSYFFLGAIATVLSLEADAPAEPSCGACTACIDACPTQAIVEPGVVDSRLCISYHTIENRGEIPEQLGRKFDGWVFGCDICQEVCPWNRFAKPTTEPAFQASPSPPPPLEELAKLSDEDFKARFTGSPIRRARAEGMRRNARIALENTRRL